jgi:hypothetical protein
VSRRKYTRHDRVRRTITEFRRAEQNAFLAATHRRLSAVLDGLDAFGVLERAQHRMPASQLCFGPKAVRGGMPAAWVGVVIWYRRPGYHNYKTLNLLGIWARETGQAVEIVVGRRTLNYVASHYNPESYFYHLQRTFETYYGSDASPAQGVGCILTVEYKSEQRLQQRSEIEAALNGWVKLLASNQE